MEDKFLDGMVDASITMMKRLSEGGTLTPDELKFILLTKQMSEKANKQSPSNNLRSINGTTPTAAPALASVEEVVPSVSNTKSVESKNGK